MYLVQVWASPGLNLAAPLTLSGDPAIIIRTVEIEPPGSPKLLATLLEMDGTQDDMSLSPDKDMRHIGKVLSRLAFGLLQPFNVFSARLIPKGLTQGERFRELVFAGPPPGIALIESQIGFDKQVLIDGSFLGGEVPPNVDGAISWFLNGLSAPNSIEQIICHWIGLEMLAPLIEGHWKCSECGDDVPECPHCHKPTRGPKTVMTIRNFLESELGVGRKEFKKLYKVRCGITHGGLAMNPEGMKSVSDEAIRIQQLLLVAIKKALNWPIDTLPLIGSHGMLMAGVPGLDASEKVNRQDFYDHPTVYPG